jgi:hypothetical protein
MQLLQLKVQRELCSGADRQHHADVELLWLGSILIQRGVN